jgi:hypothetical protein
MAILAIVTGNNLTKKMYEDVRKEANWERDHPAGAYFHAASFDDSGNNMYVADVWESEEQFTNFIRTRITPVMEKINAPKLKVEVYRIHNVNAFPSIDKYKV